MWLHDDGNLCLKDEGENVVWSSDMYMEPDRLHSHELMLMLSNMGNLGVYYKGQCFWLSHGQLKAPKKHYKVQSKLY